MAVFSIFIFFGIVLIIAGAIKGIRNHAANDKVDHIPLDAQRGVDGLPRKPQDPASS